MSSAKHEWDGEVIVAYYLEIHAPTFKNIIAVTESPFEILQRLPQANEYLLRYNKGRLGNPLTSGPIDAAEYDDSETFSRAKERLKLTPTYGINLEWDRGNPNYMEAFRDLATLFDNQKVPYFIRVEDEGPTTSFIAGGRNPALELIIENERPKIFRL